MNITQVREMVEDLLRDHGLYEKGWRFALGRGKHTLGTCVYSKRLIRISKFHIWYGVEHEVKNVILHEIAHAITGPGHGHDYVWRDAARMIGLYNPTRTTQTTWNIDGHVHLECDTHGVIAKRHRRMNKGQLERTFCKKCGRDSKGLLSQVVYER